MAGRSCILRALAALLTLLAGCGGGGGGGGTEGPPASNEPLVLTPAQASTVTPGVSGAGETLLSLPAGSELASQLGVGRSVFVPPGDDARFPLGLAGRVSAASTSTGGTTQITLAATTLARMVRESQASAPRVVLGPDNFVGLIAPAGVRALPAAPGAGSRAQGLVEARPGARLLTLPRAGVSSPEAVNVVGTVDAGSITLVVEVPVASVVDDPSRLRPYGSGADAKFVVRLQIDNLKLTENHDFGNVGGVPTLRSLDMRAEGTMSADVSLVGGVDASLGFFSQAWKEVEEQSINLLGVSAKLSGLDSKDKVGKFPLAGLVYSLPCPSSCPVQLGTTQTPLRQAKAGGVIVWVYLAADGTIKVDGTAGLARAQDLQFEFGLVKQDGGPLDKVASLSHTTSSTLIEAPYVDGTIEMTSRAGIDVELDFFASGVRFGNASLGVLHRSALMLTGMASNVWRDFSSPWAWSGAACASLQVGAGVVFAAAFDVGVEVNTPFGSTAGSVSYSVQSPTEAEMALPGWHGPTFIEPGTWYAAPSQNACWPTPVASQVSASLSGSVLTIVVAGTQLPDDAALTLVDASRCTGLQLASRSPAELRYACTLPAGATGALDYQVRSVKAANLDTSALSGHLALSPAITYPPQSLTVAAGQEAAFAVTAVGLDPLTYEWIRTDTATPTVVGSTAQFSTGATTLAMNGQRYRVRVTNALGSVQSDEVSLAVTFDGPPQPDPATYQGRLATCANCSLALRKDGTLAIAGRNPSGWFPLGDPDFVAGPWGTVTPPVPFAQVASGGSYSIAVDIEGALWVTGTGGYGELGNGGVNVSRWTRIVASAEAPVVPTQIASVATAGYSSYAISRSGELWVTGTNVYGQLGLPSPQIVSRWTRVTDVSGVAKVGAGGSHAALLLASGQVLVAGYNNSGNTGYIGLGTTSMVNRWTPIPALAGIIDVSSSGSHTLALDGQGGIWATGDVLSSTSSSFGGTPSRVFTQVRQLPGARVVVASSFCSMALTDAGVLWVAGQNFGRQFGLGPGTPLSEPSWRDVSTIGQVAAVATDCNKSLAIRSDGTLWVAGGNGFGALGLGDPATTVGAPLTVDPWRRIEGATDH